MFSQIGGTIGVIEEVGGKKTFMPIVPPDPATGRRRRGETNPQGDAEIKLIEALFPGKSANEIIEKCRGRETGWSGRERTRPDGTYIMSDGDMLHQWLDRPEGIKMRRDIMCQDHNGTKQRSTSREEARSAGPSFHVRRQFDALTPEQKTVAADAAAEVATRRENDHERIVSSEGSNYNPTNCTSVSHLYALGRAEANADWMREQVRIAAGGPSDEEILREREEAVAAAKALTSAERQREREEAVAAVRALTSANSEPKKGGRTKRKRKHGKLNKKKKSKKTRTNKRKKSRKTRGKRSRKTRGKKSRK